MGESVLVRSKVYLRIFGSRRGRGLVVESRVFLWSLVGWFGMVGEGGEVFRRFS